MRLHHPDEAFLCVGTAWRKLPAFSTSGHPPAGGDSDPTDDCASSRQRSPHPTPRYPNLVKGETAARPDDIWVADITSMRLGQGFVYLAVLMDVFTRAIRGGHLSRSLDHHLTLKALKLYIH
jgi:hypothetical protein